MKQLRDLAAIDNCQASLQAAVEIASLLNTLADERTKNMRLRAALHYYADFHENPNDGPWGMQSDDFGSVARAALEGGRT